jgi:iron-sulfur cluster repair protein YtfE (RIC family)
MDSKNVEGSLSLIEEELVGHIRFEERILFKKIEQVASVSELIEIQDHHNAQIFTEWEDEFWIKPKKD